METSCLCLSVQLHLLFLLLYAGHLKHLLLATWLAGTEKSLLLTSHTLWGSVWIFWRQEWQRMLNTKKISHLPERTQWNSFLDGFISDVTLKKEGRKKRFNQREQENNHFVKFSFLFGCFVSLLASLEGGALSALFVFYTMKVILHAGCVGVSSEFCHFFFFEIGILWCPKQFLRFPDVPLHPKSLGSPVDNMLQCFIEKNRKAFITSLFSDQDFSFLQLYIFPLQ